MSKEKNIKTANQMASSYDAKSVENKWYDIWEKQGLFKANAQKTLNDKNSNPAYVILMPPPNVTGVLHNGHALFVTLQDILIRYHRMLGMNTLWLPGTDHAGIATQTVVERELKKKENKTKYDIGRKEFIKKVWQWKEKNGNRIVEQLKLLGASADWDKLKFTMDEDLCEAVNAAFVQLWNEGLIYRGERLINWDPITKTALSNEEVDHEDRIGELWSFAYKVKNSDDEIIVATTRVETMLGDTAIAVHPDDQRYKDLVGQEVIHPFFPKRKISIVADNYVDKDFGSGAVKITPAHDHNDFALGKRHKLEEINILNLDASINENGGEFAGQDRYQARTKIKAKLTELGLFRSKQSINHNVSISQRSGELIEPMLSRQYFIKTKPLAQKAYKAVNENKTRIIPSSWSKTWDHFLLNIEDWCISRQIWWGHRIPVYYDIYKLKKAVITDSQRKNCQTQAMEALNKNCSDRQLLSIALETIDEDLIKDFSIASTNNLCREDESRYIQEEDVLDTWFSSGLWPFSTLGWPNKTDELQAFYPSSVLETGFDILFFWVARMMMLGIHFMGKEPFKDIFLHAMVRDSHGKKMSKSLGNAIDPQDVINGISQQDLLEKIKHYPVPQKLLPKVLQGIKKEYPNGIPPSGADGLRLSLSMLSGQGRDVKLSIPRITGYRSFLNKIYNATRFILMRVDVDNVKPLNEVMDTLDSTDKWILSKLQITINEVTNALKKYRFDLASESIYHFFWDDFCDWYIEFCKEPLLSSKDFTQKETISSVLLHVLESSMRLLHPFCPFISEEIWQQLGSITKDMKKAGFEYCCIAPFPTANSKLINKLAQDEIKLLQQAIMMIRSAKQQSNLATQKPVTVLFAAKNQQILDLLQKHLTTIKKIAFASEIKIYLQQDFVPPKLAATNVNKDFQVVLPLEGLIDITKEKLRIKNSIDKINNTISSIESRLNNNKFISNAPSNIVQQYQAQQQELKQNRDKLLKSLEHLQ